MENQQQSQPTSFLQQYQGFKNLLIFPALTVMLWSRRQIGYRLLNPGWLIIMAFIVWLLAMQFQDPGHGSLNEYMVFYAYSIFGFGMFQRIQAWRAIRKGTAWHTYDTGVSFFEYLIPYLRFRNRATKRFVDPAFIACVGWFVIAKYISVPFGYWVIFAAWALFWVDAFGHERAVERELDLADGLVAAQSQSETAEHFAGRSDSGPSPHPASVPTGLGADIRQRVKKTPP